MTPSLPSFSPTPAAAHDRNCDGHEHAADDVKVAAASPPSDPRLRPSPHASLPPSPRRAKVLPRLHAVATSKTRCHANLLPAIPVVTPPKHGTQDPASANAACKSSPPTTMAARTTAAMMMVTTLDTNDADQTNTGDETDNDDTRPATTMVTNAAGDELGFGPLAVHHDKFFFVFFLVYVVSQ
ncbi:hypothetical protein EDB83DRAFT_393122 [Lactarius deliciosus]|nr:hypothetical protein EDB83DRAFT_393122 [Lactarius deliciosus]